MIYTFRFISDEEDSFVVDININHDQTFDQLHQIIQKTLNYDSNQLASFFISNSDWEKQQEIALIDMGEDSSVITMNHAKIADFYNDKDEQILYVFDYFNERLFFGCTIRIIDAESPIELPSVSKLEGKIPDQLLNKTDLDDELAFDFNEQPDENFDDLPDDYEEFDIDNY